MARSHRGKWITGLSSGNHMHEMLQIASAVLVSKYGNHRSLSLAHFSSGNQACYNSTNFFNNCQRGFWLWARRSLLHDILRNCQRQNNPKKVLKSRQGDYSNVRRELQLRWNVFYTFHKPSSERLGMDGWMEHRPAMIGNHVTEKEREAVFVTNGVRKGVWAPINWADWKLRKEVFTSVADR